MRVIAGTAGGRRLVAPRGTDVRPTQDRVKEAVFSALGPARLVDAAVLDGCAGSGGLGIEALSRGARFAVFVEPDRAAERCVRANLESTGFVGHSELHACALGVFLHAPGAASGTAVAGRMVFDLVFLDPPYAMPDVEVATFLQLLMAGQWLAKNATVVIERGVSSDIAMPDGLSVSWQRRYGDTLIVMVSCQTPST